MRRAVVLALVLAGCQHSEDRYARREVKPPELVGRWMLTSYGLKSLVDVGVKSHLTREDHILLLRGNRTCAVRTVFGLSGTGEEYKAYESGCAWSLETRGHQTLELKLSPEPRTGNPHFYLAEEEGQIIIWQYATDPDAWRYLEFERVGEPN